MASADDVLQRAGAYRQLAIYKDNSHYAMALHFERRNKILGVPVVVTTAAVSTAIFATLETKAAFGWQLATGLVSLAAAVLAALQTFLNYAELAQQHKASARDYSKVRRQLELFELRHRSGETGRDEGAGPARRPAAPAISASRSMPGPRPGPGTWPRPRPGATRDMPPPR
jgi:hypothetical protein